MHLKLHTKFTKKLKKLNRFNPSIAFELSQINWLFLEFNQFSISTSKPTWLADSH